MKPGDVPFPPPPPPPSPRDELHLFETIVLSPFWSVLIACIPVATISEELSTTDRPLSRLEDSYRRTARAISCESSRLPISSLSQTVSYLVAKARNYRSPYLSIEDCPARSLTTVMMSGEAWLYLIAVLINAVNLFLQVFFTIMYSDLEWYAPDPLLLLF